MKFDGQTTAPDDEQVDQCAVERLARMCLVEWLEPSEALDLATEALVNDEYAGIRVSAATALGHLGGIGAREALKKALRDDPCESVRERCVIALSNLSDREDISALLDAVRYDPCGNVAYHAGQALARFQDPRIMETLLYDLQNGSVRERVGSAQGLGWLQQVSAVGPLTEAMRTDPYCFLPAMLALHSVGCGDWVERGTDALCLWRTSGREEELRGASEQALPGTGELFDEIMGVLEAAGTKALPTGQ